MTPTDPYTSSVLNHAARPARMSRLAILAMAIGILGLLTFFILVSPILALFLGLIAAARIRRDPGRLAGAGYAQAAVTMGVVGMALAGLGWLVVTNTHHPRELSTRAHCAAQLSAISKSMNIYAADNACTFPVVGYAPYRPGLNDPAGTPALPKEDKTMETYYKPPFPQAGSIPASVWLLVLTSQVSPKQFICKSDPFAPGSPTALTDASGNFYNNFQSGRQLSYSFAYPWDARGGVGPWWKSLTDDTLPIACDMAPEPGSGKPGRVMNPSAPPRDPKTWNSDNHQGDGQNVAFADAHVEFVRRPDVGQDHDNIFTTSAKPSFGPAQFGGLPADRTPPELTADTPPFDIIMYPTRNVDTGGM